MGPGLPDLQMPQLLDRWNFSLLHQWHHHPKRIPFDVILYCVAFVIPVYLFFAVSLNFFSVFIYSYINTHGNGKNKSCVKKALYINMNFFYISSENTALVPESTTYTRALS